MLDASADAADAYDRFIHLLIDAHRIPFERRDWTTIAAAASPPDAVRTPDHENVAAGALARYRPGWFEEVLGIANRKRARLAAAITRARALDDETFAEAKGKIAARRKEIEFARSVLAREHPAMTKAIGLHGDFTGTAIEGVKVVYLDGRVIAVVDGFEVDDLPTNTIRLLQSGKISTKPLPMSKIFELHRDTICSSALRVAAEFLKILPLNIVEVVVHCDLLDRSSGHINARPVFYVLVAAQALSNLNLELADPAPLAERLGADFEWNKREGFHGIDLAAHEIPKDICNRERPDNF